MLKPFLYAGLLPIDDLVISGPFDIADNTNLGPIKFDLRDITHIRILTYRPFGYL